jgi:hypothetical protein
MSIVLSVLNNRVLTFFILNKRMCINKHISKISNLFEVITNVTLLLNLIHKLFFWNKFYWFFINFLFVQIGIFNIALTYLTKFVIILPNNKLINMKNY